MNGHLSNYYRGGLANNPGDFSDLTSVKSDRTGRASGKSLYEQRKNYARDTVSIISETSQYHVEANLIQQDIDSAVSDSRGGRVRTRPDILRNIAASDSKVPPPPHASAPKPPGSFIQGDMRGRVPTWSSWAEYGDGAQNADREESPKMLQARIDRDVQILNHILDDIEFFIMKLQKAAEAFSELSKRRKSKKKKGSGEGVLTLRAKPPPEEEFTDCFQKFKHGFNLLAKLKPHIQNPSASELVHFLFTPLSMMVEATGGPQLARSILSPLLVKDAIDFLQFLLNEEEKKLWFSLGEAWTKSRMEWPPDQFIPPYVPRFRNGWEPPLLNFAATSKEQEMNQLAVSVPKTTEIQQRPEPKSFSTEFPPYSQVSDFAAERNSYFYN